MPDRGLTRICFWRACVLCVVGELVYLNIFGQGLLFVNSYEAAVDLLEKRGAIYSDKPKMIMAGEL